MLERCDGEVVVVGKVVILCVSSRPCLHYGIQADAVEGELLRVAKSVKQDM